MGVIGYVPVEEYVFFVTQTLTACLFYSLTTRCFAELPILSLRRHTGVPWLLGAIWLTMPALGAFAFTRVIPNEKTFYLGAIISWVSPVMFFLFFISAIQTAFLSGRMPTVVVSIVVPTLYLCWVDSIAIVAGTWHITEATSLEIFLTRGLPLEEAVFFLVTNIMVVLGCSGYDLAASIVYTYDESVGFSFASLCRALLLKRDDSVVEDLSECVELLQSSSSSFYSSSFFFNEGIRRDLIVLYAFCRASDDIADSTEVRSTVRRARLQQLRKFVQQRFSDTPSGKTPALSAAHADDDAIRRSVMRYIVPKVPRSAMLELLDGYDWDIRIDEAKSRIETEQDLLKYCEHVASSVAEMCLAVLPGQQSQQTFAAAREMGVVLQLTNIARDIVTDACNGRIYLPRTWLNAGDLDDLGAMHGQDPKGIDTTDTNLCQHALHLLEMAKDRHAHSTGAIADLPSEAQIGIKIATDGYFAIGQRLKHLCQTGTYPMRAKLPMSERLSLVIKHVYAPSKTDMLLAGGLVLRLVLMLYGNWQDSWGHAVRFTDVDYDVFCDAARFVQAGGSPYERATYRYTPLLAWLLIPTGFYANWGKVVFSLGDVVAGWLMIKLLRRRNLPIEWAAAWLLNPMVAVISTRGNCEGLLGALAIAMLYYIDEVHVHQVANLSSKSSVFWLGLWTGLAVHFKVYPIIYVPSILLALARGRLRSIVSSTSIMFALVSAGTFGVLSLIMYAVYGADFIRHTFLYHISRTDHRHNFSPYHLALYMSSAAAATGTAVTGSSFLSLVAFVPQLLLTLVIIPLTFLWNNPQSDARHATTTCFFAQTFAFVTFNKVVTSQYFLWYLVFIPLWLPGSQLLGLKSRGLWYWRPLMCLALWVGGQGLWLSYAYKFEMLGQQVFQQMWIATICFFAANVFILAQVLDDV
ncbi:GPI mannosyltransferase 1 [Savitreella phatthalungensis]